MADLNYLYSPYYGIEPFDPTSVGAKLTGQNLVVTVWTVPEKVDAIPVPGVLVQPASQNDNLLAERRAATGATAMFSRCSAQMLFIQTEGEGINPVLTDPLLLVLNPPPELRQQWSQAVTFNGGNPADPADYTVLRSLLCGYTWRVQADLGDEVQNALVPSIDLEYDFGTLTDLGNYDGVASLSMPLLATSGADGQAPTFFDRTTDQGVADMLAAVNAGEFFVPLLIGADVTTPTRFTVTYPHSAARG